MSTPNENLPGDHPPSKAAPRRLKLAVAGLAVVAATGASLYAFGGAGNSFVSALLGQRPSAAVECADARARAPSLAPLARGEVAAVQMTERPRPATPLSFQNAKGETVTLADFKGRAVLLNLWATWCVPCRQEMPALDKLQGELGGPDFEVVAVNIDTRNPDKPKAFLKEIKVERLGYYTDAKAKIFQDLKVAGRAFGMPTTLLIDRNGCELAYLAGPAEWAGADAIALVKAAIRK
jgi:thiol-disulfide isomerase/thioredoxin